MNFCWSSMFGVGGREGVLRVSYSAILLMPLRQIPYWIRIDLFDSPLSFNHLAPKTYLTCCVCVFVIQSYPTLCNLINWRLPGSSIRGIHLAREFWSVLPFPSPGDLSNPGIKSRSPALQADSSLFEPPGKPLQLLFTRKFLYILHPQLLRNGELQFIFSVNQLN